jgi:hypothetical protein
MNGRLHRVGPGGLAALAGHPARHVTRTAPRHAARRSGCNHRGDAPGVRPCG